MSYLPANTPLSDAPLVPGVTVLGELGRGANAVTYRVRRDGQDWAMKVYARQAGGGRPALLVLRREAALLTWVDHPGLLRRRVQERARYRVAAVAIRADCHPEVDESGLPTRLDHDVGWLHVSVYQPDPVHRGQCLRHRPAHP